MKSSHYIHLDMIDRTLQPGSYFRLQAAKHKALVIRDAVLADKEQCDALLRKIDHLFGEAIVGPAGAGAIESAPQERDHASVPSGA